MTSTTTLRRRARSGLAVCVAMLLAGIAHAQEQAPQWTPGQWNLLLANASHTQGDSSFFYRQRWFGDHEAARHAHDQGLLVLGAHVSPTYARSLLEVEPALRFALARLHRKGQLSAPIRHVNAAGEANGWTLLELVERGDLRKARADEGFKKDVGKWLRLGWMASPEALASDATEAARRAYWPVWRSDELAAVPAGVSADLEFGDGSTPLTRALMQRDAALARALFARGASVNRCGIWGCPLAVAALHGGQEALALVNWLLAQGARPDQHDPRDTGNPVLAAVMAKDRSVVARLLEAGAPIDGLPQDDYSPLELAVATADDMLAHWLVARGASVLPRVSQPGQNIVSFAATSKHPALRRWAEAQVLAAAAKHPTYRFTMAVEQGGRRVPANAQGVVLLKPAPFELIFELPPGAKGVALGASTDTGWADEVRRSDPRNAMYSRFNAGALANASEADSAYLLTDKACAKDVPADGNCDGGHMFLTTDATQREDFHAVRGDAARPQHVRRVQAVMPVEPGDVPIPVQRLAGQVLHLAMAIPIPIDIAAAGGTQLLPQLQTLKLQFTK